MPRQSEEVLAYMDFLSLTVSSLKDFLAIRVLKLKSKKADLIARELGAYKLNVSKKFSHQENYSNHSNLKVEHNSRLLRYGIVTDPNSLSGEAWQDSVHE